MSFKTLNKFEYFVAICNPLRARRSSQQFDKLSIIVKLIPNCWNFDSYSTQSLSLCCKRVCLFEEQFSVWYRLFGRFRKMDRGRQHRGLNEPLLPPGRMGVIEKIVEGTKVRWYLRKSHTLITVKSFLFKNFNKDSFDFEYNLSIILKLQSWWHFWQKPMMTTMILVMITIDILSYCNVKRDIFLCNNNSKKWISFFLQVTYTFTFFSFFVKEQLKKSQKTSNEIS